MSFSRVVNQRLACHSCSAAIARSFTASSTSNGSNSLRASWQASRPLHRTFTSSTVPRAAKPDPRIEVLSAKEAISTPEILSEIYEEDISVEEQEIDSALDDAPSTGKETHEAPIPWYLRIQDENNPEGVSPERNARELIPELPHNPPPLLQEILEYISITAGLDDLLLLDLRHLDPPPALGSKLIMILGTARSEKHLHVSADRFCRYLRRVHGLKANAAGLLGRNELKIKLRRKAKRMKMLANVGAQETGNIDDGIRTGWICCTIGRIDAHPDDTEIPGLNQNENFVGFSDVKPGVNVVVQMFTEEKRQEIDLETLWGGVLKSHERKDLVADETLAKEAGEVLGDVDEEVAAKERQKKVEEALEATMLRPAGLKKAEPFVPVVPRPTKGDEFPPASWEEGGAKQQRRRLHTVGLRTGL